MTTIQALAWIVAASALAMSTAARAGEPIRFVRPKADEKPLRFNFAAEKLASREALSASSFSPATPAHVLLPEPPPTGTRVRTVQGESGPTRGNPAVDDQPGESLEKIRSDARRSFPGLAPAISGLDEAGRQRAARLEAMARHHSVTRPTSGSPTSTPQPSVAQVESGLERMEPAKAAARDSDPALLSRRTESEPAGSGGLFSGPTGLVPRGPGSGYSAGATGLGAGVGTAPGQSESDKRPDLRGLLRSPKAGGVSSSAFGGVDGTFSGSLRGSLGGPPGADARPGPMGLGGLGTAAPTLKEITPSLPPRGVAAPAVSAAIPPLFAPAPTNPPPARRRMEFDPAQRPLRSNFELPTRPR